VTYRFCLNVLLAAALLVAIVVLLNRDDDASPIVIEARDPPASVPLDVAR
jgi:hypothetical protein